MIPRALARMIQGVRAAVDRAPTAVPTGLDLRASWQTLLRRRPALAGSLGVYGAILERWADSPLRVPVLAWDAGECAERWRRGLPLLPGAPLSLPAESIEPLLGTALEVAAPVCPTERAAMQRLAEAWDRGDLDAGALVPRRGGWGHLVDATGISEALAGVLAVVTLRPLLESYFSTCRAHLTDDLWRLGLCPFCGAPPGFSDVTEQGGRRLACHLCGGAWAGARLWCPFCANERTEALLRLEPEQSEQGYFVSACGQCRGYLKELDRRVRWNGEGALLEDWASPHLDLVAIRAGYRRPLPTLVGLALPAARES